MCPESLFVILSLYWPLLTVGSSHFPCTCAGVHLHFFLLTPPHMDQSGPGAHHLLHPCAHLPACCCPPREVSEACAVPWLPPAGLLWLLHGLYTEALPECKLTAAQSLGLLLGCPLQWSLTYLSVAGMTPCSPFVQHSVLGPFGNTPPLHTSHPTPPCSPGPLQQTLQVACLSCSFIRELSAWGQKAGLGR